MDANEFDAVDRSRSAHSRRVAAHAEMQSRRVPEIEPAFAISAAGSPVRFPSTDARAAVAAEVSHTVGGRIGSTSPCPYPDSKRPTKRDVERTGIGRLDAVDLGFRLAKTVHRSGVWYAQTLETMFRYGVT